MLQELYPNAYERYVALPLLGTVLDDFDNWLLAQGYRRNTRQLYIHRTVRIDKYLRKRGRRRYQGPGGMTPRYWNGWNRCNLQTVM